MDNGARCTLPVFILSAGTIHCAASKSTSSQVASRALTGIDHAAKRSNNGSSTGTLGPTGEQGSGGVRKYLSGTCATARRVTRTDKQVGVTRDAAWRLAGEPRWSTCGVWIVGRGCCASLMRATILPARPAFRCRVKWRRATAALSHCRRFRISARTRLLQVARLAGAKPVRARQAVLVERLVAALMVLGLDCPVASIPGQQLLR